MTEQTILDMCCGSRMFWFDKQDSHAVFADIRALPFADASPPNLERVEDNA